MVPVPEGVTGDGADAPFIVPPSSSYRLIARLVPARENSLQRCTLKKRSAHTNAAAWSLLSEVYLRSGRFEEAPEARTASFARSMKARVLAGAARFPGYAA
jgi:hypothetical protein